MEGLSSSIRREQRSVVAQVTPWNYPLMMALWKIGPALAAGNTLVLKPSDTTPESTVKLAEIAGEILPPGVFNVVNGDGETGRGWSSTRFPAWSPSPARSAPASPSPSPRPRAQARPPRARRERARRRLRRRRHRGRGRGHRHAGILQRRPGLHRGHPGDRRRRGFTTQFVAAALVAKAKDTRPGDRDDEDAAYSALNNADHFAKVCSILAALPYYASVVTGGRQFGDLGLLFGADRDHRSEAGRSRRSRRRSSGR